MSKIKMGMVVAAISALVILMGLCACSASAEKQGVITSDKIDLTIAYGDYGAMDGFAYKMYDGDFDGKVVHIDGIASNTQTHNIMIEDKDADIGLGVGYQVDGWADGDYPENGEHIVLTGEVKVVDEGSGARVLCVAEPNISVVRE